MTIHIEFLGDVNVYFGLGLEILTSVLLGGLIGLERERKMKPAGLKTYVLICLGSTLYTAVSILNHHNYLAKGVAGIDPNRMAAQIISGIGFLGAGAIIQSRGEILGLTTAATIWVVAAVGVAIGSGYPLIAGISTITVLVVLALIDPLYRLMDLRKEYHVHILSESSVTEEIKEIFRESTCKVKGMDEKIVDINKNLHLLVVVVTMNPKSLKSAIYRIQEMVQTRHVMVDSHPVGLESKKKAA